MNPKKTLGVGALTFINVIAIDNLRTLPFAAEFGLSSISYYLIAALMFLLPIGFVAAELATTWPERGGLYVWIREAFGPSTAFAMAWVQWIYNVLWYPIALTFVVTTFNQSFPMLPEDTHSIGLIVAALFWLTTALNFFGMRLSSLVSTVGALVGTLLPMTLIVILAWLWHRHHGSELVWQWHALWPSPSHTHMLPFLTAILFGLIGLEMSATHADEVKNPSHTFPRALMLSSGIILLSLIAATLAIASLVPHQALSVVTGISQAFAWLGTHMHWAWLPPVMNALIVLGGISSITTWIIGPSKALHIAAMDNHILKRLSPLNRHGVPTRMLSAQALVVTMIGILYHWAPSLHGIYMLLTAITAQLALVLYMVLFGAAMRLRRTQANRHRPYRIGPNWVLDGLCIMGIFSCALGITFGFIAPDFAMPKHTLSWMLLTLTAVLAYPFWLTRNKH